jgi:hypothetical protein
MKYVIVALVLCLSGCAGTVPVKMNFPQVPETLKETCPDLKTIPEGTTKLSEVVSVVSENYGQYQECKIKIDAWTEWYNTQKKIFEDVK